MAHRSQCSSAGDNPLDPNYLPPHYREEYRLAIDALIEEDLEGYYKFLQSVDVVDFLSRPEIECIQSTIKVPGESSQPEQRYLECAGDGSSSDTYWPIHSDVDAPGLDLGWPQLHRFIGPTEVTTLVNPAEPDMPTIKEQARRLIKNAQQVVAIVMDMFTDVDIFADIINATMRNVAVYILLDEQNVHHFVNMVSNCRINLESIQFLRVRTVSGITYHCRSGKTFKGQMMDRFLLTDCRAVLSGNYSFMWSFEKIHRCLAHLFLGQLVSTFDEEFRILYAQSQPLIIENVLARIEDFSHLPEGQYITDNAPLYKDPRMSLSREPSCPDEWKRQPFDDRVDVDRKNMPLSRHDSIQKSRDPPVDMYTYPSQQLRMDQPYEQGQSRMPVNAKDSPTFKRHSFAEGSHGRHPYQLMQQQGLPSFESEGKRFQREQYPLLRTGPETGYSGFRGPGYHPSDQYPESGLPQDLELDSFDPVLHYLSSTSNVDMDEVSDKISQTGEVSSHPKRLNAGQPYACQTSPTASNQPDQKVFFEESNVGRKDPKVKQGLRNYRICSYLSAYDDPVDKELPAVPPQAAEDPFEESPYSLQRRSSGPDLSLPKIPNIREFKVPPVPRASQLPSYTKPTVRDPDQKMLDDFITMMAGTKKTTTPSVSSSTTDKSEELEPKEPKDTVVRRESFRRQVNPAVQRSSRLRSSLIFSSQLEQQVPQDSQTALGQADEETDKNEGDVSKLPFAYRALGQRRSFAKEPFNWTQYVRSATFDSSNTDATKADDKDLTSEKKSQDLPDRMNAEGGPAKMSPSASQPDVSQIESPTVHPPTSVMSNLSYVDMNDPDDRLMFFKELAAKRRAEKATIKPPSESKTAPSCDEELVVASTDSEKIKLKNNQASASCPVSSKPLLSHIQSLEESRLSGPVVKERIPFHLPTQADGKISVPTPTDPTTHRPSSEHIPPDSRPAKIEESAKPLEGEPAKISASQPDLSLEASPKINKPVHPPSSLMSNLSLSNLSYVDMNDPDNRFMFFKELAGKRKATMAAAAPPESKISVKAEPDLREDSHNLPDSSFKKPAVLHEASSEQNTTLPDVVNATPTKTCGPVSLHIVEDTNASEKDKNPPKNLTVTSVPLLPNSASHSTPLGSLSSHINPSDSSSTPPCSVMQSRHNPFPETNRTEPNESLGPSALESSNQSPQETPITQAVLSSGPTEVQPDRIPPCTSSESPSALVSPHTGNTPSDSHENDSNPPTTTIQSTTEPDCEGSVTAKPGTDLSLSKPVSSSVPPSPKDVKDECSASLSLSHVPSDLHTKSSLPIASALEISNSDKAPVDIKGGSSSDSVKPYLGDTPALTESSVESVMPAESKSVTSPRHLSEASIPVENNNMDNQCEVSKELKQNKSSALEMSNSSPKHNQKEPDLTLKGYSTEHMPTETCSIFSPDDDSDFPPDTSSSEPHTLHTLTLTQASIPCELTSTGSVSPSSASTVHKGSETSSLPKHTPKDNSTADISEESSSDSSPIKPSPEVTTDLTEPSEESEMPAETKSVKSPSQLSEAPTPVENNNIDNQCEVREQLEQIDSSAEKEPGDAEATNVINKTTPQESACHGKANRKTMEKGNSETEVNAPDEAVPLSPQSKQPKSNLSRYHSSTANVISSSNLRDDTKLLLGQISANSQSRGEPTSTFADTDDYKEEEADKHMRMEKGSGIRSLRRHPKSAQEKEKTLEKIQSRRKEGKVYSRFEMAP